jgi:hypothetical protein
VVTSSWLLQSAWIQHFVIRGPVQAPQQVAPSRCFLHQHTSKRASKRE